MRIALVSDCYLPRCGGIEVHVHDLALELRRHGHDVVVLTTTDGPPDPADPPVIRFRSATDPEVGRLLTTGGFDVVHAHSSLLSPLAWSAARLAARSAIPAVLTMHSLPPPPPGPTALLLGRVAAWIGLRVRWTAVSEVAAAALRPVVPGRRVDVLRNGIDPLPWRRSRSTTGTPLTLVSTMRLVRRKRPIPLIRMLAEIRHQVAPTTPLRAVIIGSGPRSPGVHHAIHRLGLTDWVEMPGRLSRPEIQRLYADAHVYLAPARLESFGIAALEARCAGLPVVAMASGGVGEFVRSGVEGFLVDDDRGLVNATADLLNNPPLLTAIQSHNRSTLPAMSWNTVIEQHLRTYTGVDALSGFSQHPVALLPA